MEATMSKANLHSITSPGDEALPNHVTNAAAGNVPSASKRTFLMNAVVSVASVASSMATAAPSLAPARPENPDHDLIEACRELIQLYKAALEADLLFDDLWTIAREQMPDRPAELCFDHRSTPPGITSMRDRRGRLVCTPDSIEERRNVPYIRREFIGTDEQWSANATDSSLWIDVPWREMQARFNAILAAHDRHRAISREIKEQTGCAEAERRSNELFARIKEIEPKIMATKATTIEGMRAKAAVVIKCCWSGDHQMHWDTTDMNMLTSLAANLMGEDYTPPPFAEDEENIAA
jgi:hypothetical protein